jgi:acetyltransferase
MVGLGGIFIEILEDVAFAAVPINPAQANLMLDSLQGKTLLEGARGKAPVNRTALIKLICNLSQFAANHPEIVELDLNPVFADGKNLIAVDWLMMVD